MVGDEKEVLKRILAEVPEMRHSEWTAHICELKEKEVINVCSGRRLGCIADVEINICTGEIEAIVIPGPGKICGFFGTDCEYVIPFSCIKKIGPDIVLVEIKEEKFLQKF